MVIGKLLNLDIAEGDTLVETCWEIAKDEAMTVEKTTHYTQNPDELEAYVFRDITVTKEANYFGRAKYRTALRGWSDWNNLDIIAVASTEDIGEVKTLPSRLGIPRVETYYYDLKVNTDTVLHHEPLSAVNHPVIGFAIKADGYSSITGAKHVATSYYIEDINRNVLWKSENNTLDLLVKKVDTLALEDNKAYRARVVFHSATNDVSDGGTKTFITRFFKDKTLSTFLENKLGPSNLYLGEECKFIPPLSNGEVGFELMIVEYSTYGSHVVFNDKTYNGKPEITINANTLGIDKVYAVLFRVFTWKKDIEKPEDNRLPKPEEIDYGPWGYFVLNTRDHKERPETINPEPFTIDCLEGVNKQNDIYIMANNTCKLEVGNIRSRRGLSVSTSNGTSGYVNYPGEGYPLEGEVTLVVNDNFDETMDNSLFDVLLESNGNVTETIKVKGVKSYGYVIRVIEGGKYSSSTKEVEIELASKGVLLEISNIRDMSSFTCKLDTKDGWSIQEVTDGNFDTRMSKRYKIKYDISKTGGKVNKLKLNNSVNGELEITVKANKDALVYEVVTTTVPDNEIQPAANITFKNANVSELDFTVVNNKTILDPVGSTSDGITVRSKDIIGYNTDVSKLPNGKIIAKPKAGSSLESTIVETPIEIVWEGQYCNANILYLKFLKETEAAQEGCQYVNNFDLKDSNRRAVAFTSRLVLEDVLKRYTNSDFSVTKTSTKGTFNSVIESKQAVDRFLKISFSDVDVEPYSISSGNGWSDSVLTKHSININLTNKALGKQLCYLWEDANGNLKVLHQTQGDIKLCTPRLAKSNQFSFPSGVQSTSPVIKLTNSNIGNSGTDRTFDLISTNLPFTYNNIGERHTLLDPTNNTIIKNSDVKVEVLSTSTDRVKYKIGYNGSSIPTNMEGKVFNLMVSNNGGGSILRNFVHLAEQIRPRPDLKKILSYTIKFYATQGSRGDWVDVTSMFLLDGEINGIYSETDNTLKLNWNVIRNIPQTQSNIKLIFNFKLYSGTSFTHEGSTSSVPSGIYPLTQSGSELKSEVNVNISSIGNASSSQIMFKTLGKLIEAPASQLLEGIEPNSDFKCDFYITMNFRDGSGYPGVNWPELPPPVISVGRPPITTTTTDPSEQYPIDATITGTTNSVKYFSGRSGSCIYTGLLHRLEGNQSVIAPFFLVTEYEINISSPGQEIIDRILSYNLVSCKIPKVNSGGIIIKGGGPVFTGDTEVLRNYRDQNHNFIEIKYSSIFNSDFVTILTKTVKTPSLDLSKMDGNRKFVVYRM